MQEHLQSLCPTANCETLWRYDDHPDSKGSQGPFRVRIMLLNTGTGNQNRPFPWSAAYARKKDAQKDAAWLCYSELLGTGEAPHNPKVALVVGNSSRRGGREAGVSRVRTVAPPAVLPDLSDTEWLTVKPVILQAGARDGRDGEREGDVPFEGETPPPSFETDTPSLLFAAESESDSEAVSEGSSDSSDSESVSSEREVNKLQSVAPENLGRLGEEFAFRWLEVQPWVKEGSVVWVNGDQEEQQSHDLVCTPTGPPGRTHIEVKTRWRNFKKTKASRQQLARLLDPHDNYMLMVLGHFSTLFPEKGEKPKPPKVRIFPNDKWEDKHLTCRCCSKK